MRPAGAAEDAFAVGLRASVPAQPSGLDRSIGLQRIFMALELAEPKSLAIGRYEVKERLGQGGMGSVYRAWDPELQRDVAIKVLKREVTPEDTEAIQTEAKALARLGHPNVVAVYDLGVTDGQLYVAMQYIPGTDLRRRTSEGEALAWQAAIDMFIAAGRGLAAAHAAGVVHRDFKPENVLVGDDGRIVLADFGLARQPGRDDDRVEIAGTYQYMAPEVRRGRPADTASDQYSFCASIWRTLDPATEPGAPSPVMEELVQRCLRRGLDPDPEARWPSMEVLLAALEQARDDQPEDRQRALLLDRVEQSWIRGVLREGLRGHEMLALPMVAAVHHVDSPWSSVLRQGSDGEYSADDLPGQLEAGHGSLLILGGPGAGKTTALLLLAEALAARARIDRHAPVPLVLNLSSFGAHSGSLRSWVEDEVVVKYSLPRKSVAQRLDQHALALLLDGLDEVSPARRKQCITAINDFRRDHPVPTVVVSRTDDYMAVGSRFAFGAAVEVQPLPLAAVRSALANVPEELRTDSTLCTPLMISLLRGSEREARTAPHLRELYDAYVERCFARHQIDGSARERMLRGLQWLATASERAGTTELWIEQLSAAWLMHGWQRAVAKALGLSFIVLVAVAIATAVSWGAEGTVSGAPLGLCCATFAVIFNRGLSVKPIGRLRWSWRRAGRWLPLSVGIGLVLGAIYGLFYVVWVNTVFGGVVGLMCALSIGLEPAVLESPVRANQGIRQSAYNAMVVGMVGGLLGGGLLGYGVLPFMLPHLPPTSTLFALDDPSFAAFLQGGTAVGLTIGLLHGGTAVLLHAALRVVVALTTPLPIQLVPFLGEATRLAFMRRVGGGYIFMHRTLQAHFVSM